MNFIILTDNYAADTWIYLQLYPTCTLPLQHFKKMKLHSHVVVVLVCVSQNCASQCQDNSCILSTQNKELSSLQDRLCLKSKNSNTAQMRRES